MTPTDPNRDIFLDENGKPRLLKGISIYSNSTRVAELCGMLGYDLVWIELEHGQCSYTEVEQLCIAIENSGAIPVVRVQDTQRTHILRPLETGARVLIAPMINTADQAREMVRHGKFHPLGQRGANSRTRGHAYGLGGLDRMLAANDRTMFFTQVETPESLANLDEILAVDGISGIFIGPVDLSLSMGMPLDFENPKFMGPVTEAIRKARAAGKHAGLMIPPRGLLEAAVAAGADMLFTGCDLALVESAAKDNIAAVNKFIEKAGKK